MSCDDTISDYFPVNNAVRQGCVLATTLFNTPKDHVSGRYRRGRVAECCSEQSGSLIQTRSYTQRQPKFLQRHSLAERAEPLGLRVSCIKTKAQAFGDILDATVETIFVSGKYVEFMQMRNYLGNVILRATSQSTTKTSLERSEFARRRCVALPILVRMTKVRIFGSLVLPVLLYPCETWTLTGDLRSRLDSFCTMALRRILGHRWHDYISNDLALREAGRREVTCIIRGRQPRHYGHLARFAPENQAHRILSCRDQGLDHAGVGGRRPHASYLRQMKSCLKNTDMPGLTSIWAMARRRPKEYRRNVNAATRCSEVCLHACPA